MTRSRPRVLVYSEANMNLIDGSAVWAQSLCQVLSAAGADVTLLLRTPVVSELILGPIEADPHTTVVRAVEAGLAEGPHLTLVTAPEVMVELDRDAAFDVVLVRGLRLAARVAATRHFDGRLWAYAVDLPIEGAQPQQVAQMRELLVSASLVLVQTAAMQDAVIAQYPQVSGRTALWHPVLPRELRPRPHPEPLDGRPVRLGYMGKFATGYRTLEMTRLPRLLGERGIRAEVHVVGDKFNRSTEVEDFEGQMRDALGSAPGVVWHGGRSRSEAIGLMSGMDLGLCWRAPEFDRSREISTKLLEFSALGVPVLLNPTGAHRELFGEGYPLFVDSEDAIVAAVARALDDPEALGAARERCLAVAAGFSFESATEAMRALLAAAAPPA